MRLFNKKRGGCEKGKGGMHGVSSIAFFDDDSVLPDALKCHVSAEFLVRSPRHAAERGDGGG